MKTTFTLLLSFLLFSITSRAQVRYLKGTLQASQEGPGVSSPGSGVVIVKYNMATRLLEHFGNFRGLTAAITNQHIHTGAPGVSGAVTIPLSATPAGATAGGLTGSATLTTAQEADLLSGNMYTNVHTGTYPNGELRAQLTLTTDGQTEFFNARLQGAQQVPPNNTLATGMVNALVDKTTHMLYLTGTYTGLTTAANNAHIHVGLPHVSGAVIVPLIFTTTTSGSLDTSRVITQANQDSILSGNTYVNVHTATYPNGEIRGQLTQLSQMMFLANALEGSQEVPPTGSTARGTVIVKYNTTTNFLELIGDYQNLTTAANASHIHGPSGPPGATAPVLFNLNNTGGTTGVLSGTATLTEAQEVDLLAGNMYANVHNPTFPNGEIRAQLLPTSTFNSHYFHDTIQASQEIPTAPTPSTGFGTSTVLLDRAVNKVYVTASFSGLTSNIAATHIHGGVAGSSGPVVIPLFMGGTTSGTVTGVATVPRASFADSIINGFTYLNIHTTLNGGGEIRGQLGNLTLPVKLTYFNGYKDRTKVGLIWESAQEVNLSRYEIEQQSERGDWINKGGVTATGGNVSARYNFADVPFATGNDYVFYRLKIVDKDGKFSYSPIVRINFKKASAELTILINPVLSNELKYTITGLSTDIKAEVSVVDFNGRTVIKTTSSSLYNNTLPVGKLSKGMYKLVVRTGGAVLQQTFTK